MAKRKIKDVSFKEFVDWANRRAADGQWSLADAMVCTASVTEIYGIKPLFGRKKKREEAWEVMKKERFNLDAEIEL